MGSEQIRKRRSNRYTVLKMLHYEGPVRRGKIGSDHSIRKSSITSIVAELIRSGIVREADPGNPRSLIHLDTERYHAVAASVTPRACKFARVYLDGQMRDVAEISLGTRRDAEHVLGVLTRGLSALLAGRDRKVLGVGVAMPGTLDPRTGLSIYAAHLDRWRNIPVGAELQKQLDCPVLVDNDVRCQLWSCAWFDRLARDSENTIYINIHDGVACSIITHGRRIVGEHCAAGEIGHVRVGEEGRVCQCGRTDCLEAYCSIPGILEEIQRARPDIKLQSATAIAAAAESDTVVRNVLDRVAQRMARSLSGLVAVVDPHTLVIGTPDRAFSELLSKHLAPHLYTELIGMSMRDAHVVIADGVETTTIKGAAGLVIDQAFASGDFVIEA